MTETAQHSDLDLALEVRRLRDREEIRKLVHTFARAIDTADQPLYTSTFAEDAVLTLPHGTIRGTAEIAAMQGPPSGAHAHHFLGQVDIELEQDTASARSYLIATHVFASEDLSENAHAGGWYEQTFVRTAEGWRFQTVELVIRWHDKRPMI